MLAETPKAKGGEHGGKKQLDGIRNEPSNPTPTLADMGIDKKLSARSRKGYDCALKICRAAGPYTR